MSPDLLTRLATVIDPARIRTDADALIQYGRDWTRYTTPAPAAVVFPRSLAEVVALVQLARTVNDYGTHFDHPGFKSIPLTH